MDLRRRKKRSRWGADLDDDAAEPSGEAAEVEPNAHAEQAEPIAEGTRSTSSKRKRSRWGGDKPEASDTAEGIERIDAVEDHLAAPTGWEAVSNGAPPNAMPAVPPAPQPDYDLLPKLVRNAPTSKSYDQHLPSTEAELPRPPDVGSAIAPTLPPPPQPPAFNTFTWAQPQPATLSAPSTSTAHLGSQPARNSNGPSLGFHASLPVREGANEIPQEKLPEASVPALVLPAVEAAVASSNAAEAPPPGELVEGPPGEGPPGEAPPGEEAEQPEQPVESSSTVAAAPETHESAQMSLPGPPPRPAPNAQPQAAAGDAASKPEPCTLIVSAIRDEANEESLRLLFESAGKVVGCKLVKGSEGGHKGFGFVMMSNRSEAESAVEKFHEMQWGDKKLSVTLKLPGAEAKPSAVASAPWHAQQNASQPTTSLPWSSNAASVASQVPPTGLPPPPQGMPSSLPIASAYSYPPYDPYAGYGYYGYGYDPYAAYNAAQYGGAENGAQPTPAGAEQEEERPPGIEDDEAPPGMEDAVTSQAQAESSDAVPGVDAAPGEGLNGEGGEPPAPPPPPPLKKEPTIIHVPLKVPEGARKKQEERKRAREEKAQQLQAAAQAAAEADKAAEVDKPAADDSAPGGESIEGDAKAEGAGNAEKSREENGGPEARAAAVVPAKPVNVGTKGSFQEVLARRQAELAALRGGRPPPPKRGRELSQPPSRGGAPRRGRSISRSPPPFRPAPRRRRYHSRSASRSPPRHASRPSQSRSPPLSDSRSPERSPSLSRSRSPRDVRPQPDDRAWDALLSPTEASRRRKDKKEKKDKKERKEKKKKEKRRRHKEDANEPTPPVALPPPKIEDTGPAPGWIDVPFQEPSPPKPPAKPEEPLLTPESPDFRKGSRKRTKTRWQPDNDSGREEGEGALPPPPTDRHERRSRRGADISAEAGRERRQNRAPSPQVSEEGEIPLEEGEIEGELGEIPEDPSPARGKGEDHGRYDDFAYGSDIRGGYDNDYPRYGSHRGPSRSGGRGYGGRGYAQERQHRYVDQRHSDW